MLTSDKYKELGGTYCPECNSHELTVSRLKAGEGRSVPVFEFTSGYGGRAVTCLTMCKKCGGTWFEYYRLAGYERFYSSG